MYTLNRALPLSNFPHHALVYFFRIFAESKQPQCDKG